MKLCFKNVAQAGLLSSVIALAACSGDTISRIIGGSDGLVISGDLDAAATSLSVHNLKTGNVGKYDGVNMYAVEFDDLEVVATAQTDPPTTATAEVNSDGSFSVDLGEDAAGTAITVAFVNETTDAVVGEVKFTDSSKTDLNGNPKADSAVVATGSLPLGAITLAEDGTVAVPKTAVATIQPDVALAPSAVFNPTGVWEMGAYEKVPADQTVGAPDPQDEGRPHIGFKISLARFDGVDFTPTAGHCTKDASGTVAACANVTNGTAGTSPRYALSIWGGRYEQSIGACGQRTGFTADEARAFARIHITSLPAVTASGPMTFGRYIWSASSDWGGTGVAPYDQPWMTTSATLAVSSHEEGDCRSMTISGTTKMFNAWACKSKVYTGMWPGAPVSDGVQVGWNIGIQGGGCFDTATQKPINVTNWNNINSGANSCTNATATGLPSSFKRNECTYTGDPDGSGPMGTKTFICEHTGGNFEDAGGNPNLAAPFNPNSSNRYLGRPEPILAMGAACSSAGSATDAAVLAGYRCYANAYWRSGGGRSSDGCQQDFNFNWNATKPWDFVSRDGNRGRPRNAFITNVLNYANDGKSAVLDDEEEENITVPTSATGSTFCKVIRKTQLTFKSITATKMLVELKEGGRMASTDAACIAAANNAKTSTSQDNRLGEVLESMTLYFYLNKQ